MKPEFKATKESLLALVEAANNTNGSGDFVEAGESIQNLNPELDKDE
tara:strand:+ start:147 stop:287 length:141 start_codon:yes stop_codon:yes gene_type:complete